MNIHEFQGKSLLSAYGVEIQEGFVAETASQAVLVAKQLQEKYGSRLFVVKAQVHACLLYTSDAADDLLCVDLGGRRIIKKKNKEYITYCIQAAICYNFALTISNRFNKNNKWSYCYFICFQKTLT